MCIARNAWFAKQTFRRRTVYRFDAFSLTRKINGERRKICRKTSVERLCGQVIRTEDGQGQAFVIFRAEKSDAVYSAMG